MPRCFRSRISAATGLSIDLQRSISPASMSWPALVPWKSQPQSNSCTNRTPRSTSRRASRQLLAKAGAPGLRAVVGQHVGRLAADVHHLGHDALHAKCHLVLGDSRDRLGLAQFLGLDLVQVAQCVQLMRRSGRSMPLGFDRYKTGSPPVRH